jgi:cell division septum initiation protein DivIVA
MSIKGLFSIDWEHTDFSSPIAVKALVQHLANLVEALYQENLSLKEENQRLKDEINRLKGEKGNPLIKSNSPIKKDEFKKKAKAKKEWKKQSKLDKVKIDKTRIIRYEGALPDDAQHKGYRSVVVQGLIIKTNNIEYELERYYSPSEGNGKLGIM